MIQQKLQLKLQQKLSPLQIQTIKLLEIPTIELEDRIKEELESNPALEEGEELSKEESISKLKEKVEKIRILEEEGPWYNRFYKSGKHSRINDKYKSFKPQTKKKGTRNK